MNDANTQRILDEVTVLRGLSPKPMTFGRAWALVRQTHPDWFLDNPSGGTQHPQLTASEEAALARAYRQTDTVWAQRVEAQRSWGEVTVECDAVSNVLTGESLLG